MCIKKSLIAVLVTFLFGCAETHEEQEVVVDVDIPVHESDVWKFLTVSWAHPIYTESGKDLPVEEIDGYYLSFTDVNASNTIDFVVGNFSEVIVSIPAGDWRVEVYTRDINGYISDPSKSLYIDDSLFNNYGAYAIHCDEPEVITACLSPYASEETFLSYFNCSLL